MFNINLTKQKLLQKQYIAIISILIGGSLLSIAYATSVSDTTSIFQDISVLGSCTGCNNEVSFTTYSLVLNKTVTDSNAGVGITVLVADDKGTVTRNGNSQLFTLNPSGNPIAESTAIFGSQILDPQQSSTGKYKIMYDTNGTVTIIKSNAILFQTVVDTTNSFNSVSGVAVGISPDGKYFAIFGTDKGVVFDRIQIWQGS